MTTPNPLAPVKGAGTTLWLYKGKGDPYASPLSDTDWERLAKIRELTPGEMTAESYDDSYLDDENADWTATAQGAKSAGDTSLTLAWIPGEEGQKSLVAWFTDGDVRAYKIKYPNGTVDVFKGWCSSLGKAVPAKEVITRTVKITNTGKPELAEETVTAAVAVTGIRLDKSTVSIVAGASTTLNVSFLPAGATDQSFRLATSDNTKAKVVANGKSLTVTGVAAGAADIIVLSNDGSLVAVCKATVTAPAA